MSEAQAQAPQETAAPAAPEAPAVEAAPATESAPEQEAAPATEEATPSIDEFAAEKLDDEIFKSEEDYKGVDYKDPDSFGEFQLSYRAGDIISPRLDNYEPLSVEVAHFFECIRNGQKPKTDGLSGLRVVRALEAAQSSLENNGHPETIK